MDRLLFIALMASISISTVAVVALLGMGRLRVIDAVLFVAMPWVLLAAAFRPDWLLLGFIAMPATVTADLQVRRVIAVVGLALVMLLVTRRRFSFGWATGLAALVVINVAGHLFKAQVEHGAGVLNRETMLHLTLYVLLGLLALNLAVLGELDGRRLGSALVLGVVTTLLVGLAGYGGGWFEGGPGIMSHTYFASLAAAAFGVTLAPLLIEHGPSGRGRLPNLLMTGILLSLTIASPVRAAWAAAAITSVLLAFWLGRRGYSLILVAVIALALLTPTVRERISRSESGDIEAQLRTGEITTGRWRLWTELWDHADSALPWGNGFGYVWSLSTLDLFGEQGGFQSEESGKVPSHNDFVYMVVEFGIPGVLLLAIFWFRLFSAHRLVRRSADPLLRRNAWLFLGVIVTGFIVAMIDNIFSVRPIGERFFPIAGFVFGLAEVERARRRNQAALELGLGVGTMSTSPR